jgi:uncharacterized membrane protein (DUF2068 family)
MSRFRPTGVTLIAALYFIGGGLNILGAILILSGSAILEESLPLAELGLPAHLGISLAIGPLIVGIINLAIGWGLWELREWARVVTIILNGLGLLITIIGLIQVFSLSVVSPSAVAVLVIVMVIYGFIIWYLMQPDVRRFFDGYEEDYYPQRPARYGPTLPPTRREVSPPPTRRRTEEVRASRMPRTKLIAEERAKAMAWLVVQSGPRAGKQFELSTKRHTVGRDSSRCDIVLDDPGVSAEHARLQFEHGQFVLYDLASTNGTFVNKRRIQKQSLMDGDVIQMGEIKMVFKEVRRPS